MEDERARVCNALIDLLRWDRRKALNFLDVLAESECEDILEHVRESGTPIVGVAAVVYRVRLRLAGDDRDAKQRAGVEANVHFQLIPLKRASGQQANAVPDQQPPKIYNCAPLLGRRRREYDTR